MATLSDPFLSAVFSNLAKAAEKQQLAEDSQFFVGLSNRFVSTEPATGNLEAFQDAVVSDIESGYPAVSEKASDEAAGDSGAQRCVKWGEKVTSIQKSLLNRYVSKGEDLFDGKNLYICEACGFIALGSEVPDICPVCKAPPSRFSKIR